MKLINEKSNIKYFFHRFQKTVQALEEESQAEKRQLQAMHQQRVISMINQKKKVSMNCYTKALNDNAPNTHRVQKCLQKLLRALHKDRHHTIQHFRHLLETSLEQVLMRSFKWLQWWWSHIFSISISGINFSPFEQMLLQSNQAKIPNMLSYG